MRFLLLFVCLGLATLSSATRAEEDVKANITHGLQSLLPDMEITGISPTPIQNIYQVMMGPDIVYMTGDGRYLLKGDLLDLLDRRNLTEEVRSVARIDILKNVSSQDLIEFAPEKTKHFIYVFTDVDCSYCRRLHQDVPALNQNGVAVRYLAFPRAGMESKAYRDMVSVWCANDRRQALTDAKNGKAIEHRQCDNPVSKQYQIGRSLGIRGTPAIFLENGTELPGYMPPDKLVSLINNG